MFRFGVIGIVLLQLVAGIILTSSESAYFGSYETLSTPYETNGDVQEETLAWCEDLVAQAFAVLPEEHVNAIHDLTLSFDPDMRRGLAGGNTLILRCVNTTDEELVAVLLHELGHVVDTGMLMSSSTDYKTSFVDRGKIVYSSDPSAELYGVSWDDNRSLKSGQHTRDFISGYAKTNPYEEFAEMYAAYVLHGPLFRLYAAHDRTLQEKYEFMKEVVFEGREFDFAHEPLPPIREVYHRTFDVTRLDYNLESFLTHYELEDSKNFYLEGYLVSTR